MARARAWFGGEGVKRSRRRRTIGERIALAMAGDRLTGLTVDEIASVLGEKEGR
jgi:hypothetical protein